MKIIPSFNLRLEPLDEIAKAEQGFKWASKEIGQRHKLGGVPDFLQEEYLPTCLSCQKKMTFYAQLDSIGDNIQIADCGMIYVFLCFDCFETSSLVQSY